MLYSAASLLVSSIINVKNFWWLAFLVKDFQPGESANMFWSIYTGLLCATNLWFMSIALVLSRIAQTGASVEDVRPLKYHCICWGPSLAVAILPQEPFQVREVL